MSETEPTTTRDETAYRVRVAGFEGPLDLLLHLVRVNEVDIADIPIVEVTEQYNGYLEMMREFNLEIAGEYLVMAATLIHIKSRMLLPPDPEEVEEQSEDPRAELVRRLQEYEQFKQAAEDLDALDRLEREIHLPSIEVPRFKVEMPLPQVSLNDLMSAFRDVVNRAEQFASHHVDREPLSVRERMVIVLERISADEFTSFGDFFDVKEGRMGVVVSFIAILELLKESLIELVQSEPYAPIYVKAKS